MEGFFSNGIFEVTEQLKAFFVLNVTLSLVRGRVSHIDWIHMQLREIEVCLAEVINGGSEVKGANQRFG